MKKLIQLADDHKDTGNAEHVKLLSREGDQIPALTYLIGNTMHGKYFLQTMSMKIDLNISARNEFDPASLSGALKVLDGHLGYEKQAIWQTAEFYQAQLLAHEFKETIKAPMTRPSPGTIYTNAEAEEISRFIELPTEGWAIGALSNQEKEVPVRVNGFIIDHHLLVGGTTGHGKSNTLGNLAWAAREASYVPIIFDHKPDFIRLKSPNSASHHPHGIEDAVIWSLSSLHSTDRMIYVPPSEFANNMELLAATYFYKQGEENLAEMFAAILAGYATIRNGQTWGWQEFLDWFDQYKGAAALAAALPTKLELHSQTYAAIQRKLRTKSSDRLPDWIRNASASKGPQWNITGGNSTETFLDAVKPGSAHVIRLDGEHNNRGYALFLDYILDKLAQRRLAGGPKIFNIIEEASDIFASKSRVLREQAIGSLTGHIRKGRSLKIGFCISVQSAGDIPEEIRQNLNSVIAFKHKHPSVLREILPEQANDIFSLANNLQRGEALVQLFGVRGLLHTSMFVSPFELYLPAEDAE